jgi:hypothetical protein
MREYTTGPAIEWHGDIEGDIRPQGLMCLALYASVTIERQTMTALYMYYYGPANSRGAEGVLNSFVSALRIPEDRFQLLGQRIPQTEMG